MVASVKAFAVHGVNAQPIIAEVNSVGVSIPSHSVVGLADGAVKESMQRVETAIKSRALYWPRARIVVNLAPADVRKEGSSYDLTIAIGILAASGQIGTHKLEDYIVMGELSLNGELRPIRGVLPIAIEARRMGIKGIVLPAENAEEAAIVSDLEVIPVKDIEEAAGFLDGRMDIPPVVRNTRELFAQAVREVEQCFSAVQGQENIKRALEIAAAGGHNVIMIGPPGAGKTMLAKRLSGILPPLTLSEALETTKIHSVAGKLQKIGGLVSQRPFRSPHHTISDVALVGGGNIPQPGEISLSHNGVLFLDELPEFKRTVLEVMRQPLEDRKVSIARAKLAVEFPANFMLVASMNPCPCGYYNHPERECHCSSQQVQKYLNRISGPLMDRIDLHVEVTPVSFDAIASERKAEPSEAIRVRVEVARERQIERFKDRPGLHNNSMMDTALVKDHCKLDEASRTMLKTAMNRMGLSARAYDRILKVSRTIADLDSAEAIRPEHVAEAIQYRSLDRSNWGEKG